MSFPGSANKPYVVALSASGFTPNPRLADGRVVPITPDVLTAVTAAGPLLPYLTNNVGTLDGSGSARARLDLNPLGQTIQGLRLWAVAVTLDANAPSGIAEISAPIVLVL